MIFGLPNRNFNALIMVPMVPKALKASPFKQLLSRMMFLASVYPHMPEVSSNVDKNIGYSSGLNFGSSRGMTWRAASSPFGSFLSLHNNCCRSVPDRLLLPHFATFLAEVILGLRYLCPSCSTVNCAPFALSSQSAPLSVAVYQPLKLRRSLGFRIVYKS